MTESGGRRRTKRLLIGAVAFLVGIPLFALLHNLFDALSRMTSAVVVLSGFLGFLGVACFMAALFLCPVGATICLVAAVLDRLTTGWGTTPRRILLFLAPAVAAGAAVIYLGASLSPSTRETDETAGFNGSFEVVKSGYPANWNVYHRPLDDGGAELSFDTAEPIDGAQSLKLLVHRAGPGGGWRSPIREIIDAETTGDGIWREFIYTYTVPEHYSNIRFELNVLAPGTLWVDDVRIEPASGRARSSDTGRR